MKCPYYESFINDMLAVHHRNCELERKIEALKAIIAEDAEPERGRCLQCGHETTRIGPGKWQCDHCDGKVADAMRKEWLRARRPRLKR